jgi:SAM-dependent methyltransferase
MHRDEERAIAAHQRRRFNEAVDVFDAPQPAEVMARLAEIVAAAGLRPGEAVLDVGAGVGVLAPLIEAYRPSLIVAYDLSEKMLARLRLRHSRVLVCQADITQAPLAAASVDAIFMNAMFGNISDKPQACREAARMLRPGGRLIVSHPEGKAFVDHLRATSDLFIEPLPAREEFERLVAPPGLEILSFRDEPKLYLSVAQLPHLPRRLL